MLGTFAVDHRKASALAKRSLCVVDVAQRRLALKSLAEGDRLGLASELDDAQRLVVRAVEFGDGVACADVLGEAAVLADHVRELVAGVEEEVGCGRGHGCLSI